MTFSDKLKKLRGVCTTNYWAHRIYAELCYMACLSETKEHIYDARLETAMDELLAGLAAINGQQHAALQLDQLRRQHHKFGGYVDIRLLHLADVLHVLLRDLRDPDVVDAHLRVFDKVYEKVERTFKDIQSDPVTHWLLHWRLP